MNFTYQVCDCNNYWSNMNNYGYDWVFASQTIPVSTMTVNYRPCQKGDSQAACVGYTGQSNRASQNFSVPKTSNPIISLTFQIPAGITVNVMQDVTMGSDPTVAYSVGNGYVFRDPNNANLNGRSYYFANPSGAGTPFTVNIIGNYQ